MRPGPFSWPASRPGVRPRAAGARRAARRLILLMPLLAAPYACMTSPAPRLVAHATSPFGSVVDVRLRDGRPYAGELLAVGDSSLVVLTPANRVAVARFADVARVAWGGGSSSRAADGRRLTAPAFRERARKVSRFPFGLPDATMRTLLARFGQTAPDTLGVVSQ